MPTTRIEAFSDGVFAIIITLLILTIQVPQIQGPDPAPALARSLAAMAPKFLSYALSFAIVCIWWVAHHHFFALLTKSDRGLLWLNSAMNPLLHIVAVLLALVNTRVALALYVAIPLYCFFFQQNLNVSACRRSGGNAKEHEEYEEYEEYQNS